jgi:signal transduction histidine kinase
MPPHKIEDDALLNLTLYGYKEEFRHVLEVILQNSIDAISREIENDHINLDDAHMEIHLFYTAQSIQISFIDNGDGMNQKIQDSISFPRAMQRGILSQHLSLAKGLIEHSFHGRLDIYHHRPKGTTVLIEIPIR